MRKIKFRGKSLKYGNWLFGSLWVDGEEFSIIYQKESEEAGEDNLCNISVRDVDPETVGQYTGLKDKTGKDIYEGDIVNDSYGYIHIIKYNEQEAKFTAINPHSILYNGCSITQAWINECGKEVIGNIHDNPKLLGSAKGQRQ